MSTSEWPDEIVVEDIHDFGGNPCGKPAYQRVGKSYGWAYIFDGHRTLDGSTPAYRDPLICAGCGQDTGLEFTPTSKR